MHIYVNIGPGNVAVEGDIVDHGNGTISVQDGGLALFIVSVLLVFLSMKRFFDIRDAHR